MADPTLKRHLDAGDFVVAPGVFDMMTVLIVELRLVV